MQRVGTNTNVPQAMWLRGYALRLFRCKVFAALSLESGEVDQLGRRQLVAVAHEGGITGRTVARALDAILVRTGHGPMAGLALVERGDAQALGLFSLHDPGAEVAVAEAETPN